MFTQLFNWRTLLAMVAIAIVTGTIFYSQYLSRKIATEERNKVNVWVQSLKTRAATNDQSALNLTNIIAGDNTTIPIIATDEYDRPLGEYLNLDSGKIKTDSLYLKKKIQEFKHQHDPIIVELSSGATPLINKYYYGESSLLMQSRYYPIAQLMIIALFIVVTLITISIHNRSAQNQVWAGMAKETAHQLGTPISSLQGWIEMLHEIPGNDKVSREMQKDVERLKLVSDRFGKIGSTPALESTDVVNHIESMVAYIRRRATDRVLFRVMADGTAPILANINAPLFDWVIENLLKNALDAMDGKGSIDIAIRDSRHQVVIDVKDSGKGISKQHIRKVFKPGFTTKKRGWGLGLSLSRRIINEYHRGELFVRHSEPGKGTTFRIVLEK